MNQFTELKELIIDEALEMGFNDVRFTRPDPLIDSEKKFLEWRKQGLAGDMNYLLRDDPINARPKELLKEAKSIIIFTANYYSPAPPRPSLEHGRVAAYAVGLDYHKVLKKKLKELIKKLEPNDLFKKSRIFSDAVPLLEKSYAKKAGLGFKGKNTLLISKESGSFNFIAEIVTDIDFEPDSAESNLSSGTCANCTRCIDICPTDALIDAHKIDARLCISYLTIENKGSIDPKLRPGLGEWLFGCDLCQTVCPYNRKGKIISPWKEFQPENGIGHWIYLPDILSLDPIANPEIKSPEEADEIFHDIYCRSPISRPKRKGLIRNAMIVAANSKAAKSLELIRKYINHEDQILSETAKWAYDAQGLLIDTNQTRGA